MNGSGLSTSWTGRSLLFLLVFATIGAGLCLRRYGYSIGLTFPVVKYGGSLLWGSMVCFLVALLSPEPADRIVVARSLAFAIVVELTRLVHIDVLDAFRLTQAGALLLGRVFSVWNIIAYAAGILAAYAIVRRCRRKPA